MKTAEQIMWEKQFNFYKWLDEQLRIRKMSMRDLARELGTNEDCIKSRKSKGIQWKYGDLLRLISIFALTDKEVLELMTV